MGKLTDEQLDKLFQDHLLGLEKDPSKDAWSILAKDVVKNNFLTFGWKHFNIYQLIAGLAIFSLTIFYFIKQEQPALPIENKRIPISPNSPVAIDSVSRETKIESIRQSNSLNKKNKSTLLVKEKNNTVSSKASDLIIENENQRIDSSSIISDLPIIKPEENNNPEIKTKEQTPKIRKVIRVIKRDTIVVKDTVSVKKKRKTK